MLVPGGNNFMHWELKLANKVVCTQILNLLRIIIRIVDLCLELLGLLEVEIERDFGDPFRIKVVMYNLCLS